MNGAESLVHTLIASGIDTVFANPGTSEMHFVAALDRIPGIRCVLCLDESVVTGAADAYFRITGRPAATLLHCGPGFANAISNLHNAHRARSGIVNIVGDQATYHVALDAPLTSNLPALAGAVSGFVRRSTRAADVAADTAATIAAARDFPGQVATLILPADTAWEAGSAPLTAPQGRPATPVHPATIATALDLVRRPGTTLLLGGTALSEPALAAAHRIAAATGTRLLAERSPARLPRGRGRLALERIPYPPDAGIAAFADTINLILVNTPEPVTFFAYPNKPGRLAPPSAQIFTLSRPEDDGQAALIAVAENFPETPIPDPGLHPSPATGDITPAKFAASLAALMPENCIIAEESLTFGRDFFRHTHAAPPHDWIMLTGGAIGEGIPLAIGAALAAPARRVIALQADGSAMYSISGLWTQAREKLDICTIIFNNRAYAILRGELAGVRANPGPTALSMLDLSNPTLDFCAIATGMGVPASRATTMDELNLQLAANLQRPGPTLIELIL
jgi:acetolactate synthase-1/2/3 large subunit